MSDEHVSLDVYPNLEETPWSDLDLDAIKHGLIDRIGLLPNGTVQGRPTVAVVVTLDSGERIVAETTWRLLRSALTALLVSPVISDVAREQP